KAAVESALRCPDPFLRIRGKWVLRRLAPDCSRIELAALATVRDVERLLRAMGREAANVHLGRPSAAEAILADLEKRPTGWLTAAAKAMLAATAADWQEWQAGRASAALPESAPEA